MWIVKVVCSDPDCAEEQELIIAELDEADAAVCECGCCVITLAVANFYTRTPRRGQFTSLTGHSTTAL
ncbi:MAG: hypothetical protein ACTHK3_01455 [Solirubrobacterales bacterium]